MLAMASGRSANRRAISRRVLRWRSALRASRRPASSRVTLLAHAGEHVEDFACGWRGMADAVGRHKREADASGRDR